MVQTVLVVTVFLLALCSLVIVIMMNKLLDNDEALSDRIKILEDMLSVGEDRDNNPQG